MPRAPRQTWDHLGTDIRVTDGNVAALPAGDCDLVRGWACLLQDLYHRLTSQRGCLRRHPEWGCNARLMVLEEMTPATRAELVQEVKAAVLEESRLLPETVRVREVPGDEDEVRVEVEAVPVGRAEPFIFVLGYGTRLLAGDVEVTMEVVRG